MWREVRYLCKIIIVCFLSSDIDHTVCITRWQALHHHQLVFFSTPTPIKTQLVMLEARRRVQPGVQRTLQYYSFCYKKQRRVVEIEIRLEIET